MTEDDSSKALADTLHDAEADADAIAAEAPGSERQRGATIGRYVVLERVGAGGMGVVYAAYDPTLDRKIALKLLHPRRESAPGDYQVRLLREAQAMAKLAHPNVVAVHGVDMVDDRVVVAMEYVTGGTLAEWMSETDQPWGEVLPVFTAAGLGLAAAHAQGIIHRDFKPANVMLGEDGRPRVTDFGLARPEGGANVSSDVATTAPALQASITLTGSVVGTLAYMAPEQHLGKATDARADVFAFCVSLYQALYGERPFAGSSGPELLDAIEHQRVRPAPKGSDVPRWLREVVLKGLRAEPEQRHASMHALVTALTPRRRSRLGLAVVGVAVVAVIGIGVAATREDDTRSDQCAVSDASLDGAWGPARQEAIRSAFLAAPLGEASWRQVERGIGAYVDTWNAMREDSCAATYHRGDQTELVHGLRLRCLARRRAELDELTRVFSDQPDEQVIERAPGAVTNLTGVESCADADNLLAVLPLPDAPADRARVIALEQQLARVNALRLAGKWARARELAPPLVAEADAIGYAPLLASAIHTQAKTDPGARASLQLIYRGLDAAVAGRDRMTEAMLWISMVSSLSRERRTDAALMVAEGAKRAIVRAGGSRRLQAVLLNNVAVVHMYAGDIASARAAMETVVREYEDIFGPDSPRLATALANLAVVLKAAGDLDEAERAAAGSLAIRAAVQDENHPDVAHSLSALAKIQSARGDHAAAAANLRRALELLEATLGKEHTQVGHMLRKWAVQLTALGSYEDAQTALDRANAIFDGAAMGADDEEREFLEDAYAELFTARGDHARARQHLLTSYQIVRGRMGDEHVNAGVSLISLGENALARGTVREGLGLCRDGLAIVKSNDYLASIEAAAGQRCIGIALLRSGRADESIAPLEASIATLTELGAAPIHLAQGRFRLGEALWRSPSERTRARALVQQAHEVFAGSAGAQRALASQAEAWLAKHPL